MVQIVLEMTEEVYNKILKIQRLSERRELGDLLKEALEIYCLLAVETGLGKRCELVDPETDERTELKL